MKNMIIPVLFLLPATLFGQISGIPEQDSILFKKDRIMILNMASGGKYQLEYDWLSFQWQQWVMGKKQRMCMYSSKYGVYYTECGIDPGFDSNYLKDTLIHIPLPISFEGFMDYRISKIK